MAVEDVARIPHPHNSLHSDGNAAVDSSASHSMALCWIDWLCGKRPIIATTASIMFLSPSSCCR